MVAQNCTVLRPACRFLSYAEASALAGRALADPLARIVLLDLSAVQETTTAALARLIVLRQLLLRAGRDLHVTGLAGRAENLYRVCRLEGALPRGGALGGFPCETDANPRPPSPPRKGKPVPALRSAVARRLAIWRTRAVQERDPGA